MTDLAVRRLNHDLGALNQARGKLTRDAGAEKKALAAIAAQRQTAAANPDPAVRDPQLKSLDAKAQRTRDQFDRAIAGDKRLIAKDLRAGRHHLRPAEYRLDLKTTNRDRHALGLHAVSHAIRPPPSTRTVAGCAQLLLRSPNVSFWTGLSTGSERKTFEALAHGHKAYVPHTGGHVMPKLKMMQALVAMSKHGHIMINALTGGTHSPNSNHYRGTAVDLDVSTGNHGMIEHTARQHGGLRNSETDHIHLDF